MKSAMIVSLGLLLGACAMEGGKTVDKGAALVGTNWVLTRLGETPVAAAAGQREPFLQLQASDGRVSGFAGCNMFAGPYQLAGDQLSFGPLAMTRMACPPPGMTVEGGYANALRAAKGYKISGNRLALIDESGKTLASFEAKGTN